MLTIKNLPIIVLSLGMFGCSVGNVGNPQISAAVTQGSCTNMTGGSTCTIQLTYNTNGTANPVLSYTPTQLPQGITNNNSFSTGVNACQTNINSNSQGTCNITITYSSQGSPGMPTVNIAFVLAGVTSNTIPVSGSN